MTDEKKTAGLRPAVIEASEDAQPHNPSNPLLVQALRYAERGWAVFPLKPMGKEPLTLHGFKDASKDKVQIAAWWEKHPNANIGLATGAVSGIFVLDVDDEDGEQALKSLENRHDPLPPTGEVITGRGRHLYFKMPDHVAVISSAGKLGKGLDVRGDGGYIVAPPSIHESGRPYTKSVDSAEALSFAPSWLLELIRGLSQEKRTSSASGWRKILNGIEEGQRNDSLSRLTGLLLGSGLHPHIVAELCLCWNEARCKPPLSFDEAIRTINSIATSELQKKGGRYE